MQAFLDAIICDPPYGVRAGGRKGVAKAHAVTDSESHIPSTDPYSLEECLQDLLHMAAKYLKVGGRAVFFLPALPGVDKVLISLKYMLAHSSSTSLPVCYLLHVVIHLFTRHYSAASS